MSRDFRSLAAAAAANVNDGVQWRL